MLFCLGWYQDEEVKRRWLSRHFSWSSEQSSGVTALIILSGWLRNKVSSVNAQQASRWEVVSEGNQHSKNKVTTQVLWSLWKLVYEPPIGCRPSSLNPSRLWSSHTCRVVPALVVSFLSHQCSRGGCSPGGVAAWARILPPQPCDLCLHSVLPRVKWDSEALEECQEIRGAGLGPTC